MATTGHSWPLETLTFVPFDRRLILRDELSPGEKRWLDSYHAEVLVKLGRPGGRGDARLAEGCLHPDLTPISGERHGPAHHHHADCRSDHRRGGIDRAWRECAGAGTAGSGPCGGHLRAARRYRQEPPCPDDHPTKCPWKGQASYYSIKGKVGMLANAAWTYEDPLPEVAQIAGHLAFYPDRVTVTRG